MSKDDGVVILLIDARRFQEGCGKGKGSCASATPYGFLLPATESANLELNGEFCEEGN